VNKSPVILLTPSRQGQGVEFGDHSLSLSFCYTEAILAAGGLPWIMPHITDPGLIAKCVRRVAGVMLTGGDDVQADLYDPAMSKTLRQLISDPDPHRDLAELLLINEVFRQRKPLLAICRGQQILNVAFGGGLIADIRTELPTALDHRQPDRKDEWVHEVSLTGDSQLISISDHRHCLRVNSSHHQAVGTVAGPFRVTGTTEDGVAEVMELVPAEAGLLPYLLSVQFHPERLFNRYPEHLALFRSFIRASA